MSKLARMKASAVATVMVTTMLMSTVPSMAASGMSIDQVQNLTVSQVEVMSPEDYSKVNGYLSMTNDNSYLDKTIGMTDEEAKAAWDESLKAEDAEWDRIMNNPIDTSDMDSWENTGVVSSASGTFEDIFNASVKSNQTYYGKFKVPMDTPLAHSAYGDGWNLNGKPIVAVPRTVYKTDYKSGFVAGYPDGTFKPEAKVTRAEFLSMLAGIIQKNPNYYDGKSGEKSIHYSYNYADIETPYYTVGWWKSLLVTNPMFSQGIVSPVMPLNDGEYYNDKEYFGWLLTDTQEALNARAGNTNYKNFVLTQLLKDYKINKGVVHGISYSQNDDKVIPDAEASREYVLYVLNSVLDLSDYSDHSTQVKDDILKYYKMDPLEVSQYQTTLGTTTINYCSRANGATEAVLRAYNAGIVKGSDGYIRPKDSITRAELVTILNRIFYSDVQTPAGKKMKFSDVAPNAWYYNDILKACK